MIIYKHRNSHLSSSMGLVCVYVGKSEWMNEIENKNKTESFENLIL